MYKRQYISTREQGKTIKMVEMPVEKRAKPQEYEEPEEKEILGELLEKLNKKGEELQLDGKQLKLLSNKKPISLSLIHI